MTEHIVKQIITEHFSCSVLSLSNVIAGVNNQIFKVDFKSSSQPSVIIKIYSNHHSEIDRDLEHAIAKYLTLSSKKVVK